MSTSSSTLLVTRRVMSGRVARLHRSISSQTTKKSASQRGVIQATNIAMIRQPSSTSLSSPSSPTLNSSSTLSSSSLSSSSSFQTKTNSLSNSTTRANIMTRFSLPFSSSSVAGLSVQPQKLPGTRTVVKENNDLLVDMEHLQALASRQPTALKLADMYKYAVMRDPAQRLRNAQFLHKELPIRIAQRAVDLLTLPHGLNQSMPIRNVAHIYLRYLNLFETLPSPTTMEEEDAFTEMLTGIMLDRTSIPMDIARGIHAWHDDRREDLDPNQLQEMEDALYRFFTARVGLRFLTEHHILSSPNKKNKGSSTAGPTAKSSSSSSSLQNSSTDDLGCIQTDCNPVKEIELMAERVTRQTKAYFGGICPQIEISAITTSDPSKFTYVPHHLQYMISELLKNSCRATVRKHLAQSVNSTNNTLPEPIPPIKVVVVHGAEDVTIKVCDRGGGVPRSTMKQIWKFAHSTTKQAEGSGGVAAAEDYGELDEITGGGHIRGFGLPLCRIYARYFGGELTLKSMEGYGLDAYLYLPRLGDSCEKLPLTVKDSPGALISMPTTSSINQKRSYMTSTTAARAGTLHVMPEGRSDVPLEENTEQEARRILHLLQSRAL